MPISDSVFVTMRIPSPQTVASVLCHRPVLRATAAPILLARTSSPSSKNRRNLLYSYTDQVDQISDYVLAAQLLGRPLWLYTRVDTLLDPAFYRLVESTGGGVVAYFTTPSYVDPVDQAAQMGLKIALVTLALMSIWELGARRLGSPAAPKPKDPLAKSRRQVNTADDFLKAAKDRAQQKIDVEDARQGDDE